MALVPSVLVLLAAFFAVEGVNIPPPRIQESGKLFAGSQVLPDTKLNDPRCTKNGVFANLNDCTAYYACLDGTSQDRKCPEGMRFDTRRHCTFAEDPDCGVTRLSKMKREQLECPSDYGIYPYIPDCHKYIVCVDGVPSLRVCPEPLWFQENVGCIEGSSCPREDTARASTRRNELSGVTEN